MAPMQMENQAGQEDNRLSYELPILRKHGRIAGITESGGTIGMIDNIMNATRS
jgi:hypothetical protein